MDQRRMPFVEALENYKNEKYRAFHTPGHKLGQGAPLMLKEWMGTALPYDLGLMYALDDLHEPEGYLAEAQQLAAKLYGSDHTFFSINGTTSLIETMIISAVMEGDEILIPREAHRSVNSGLILSGAMPVYMESNYNNKWGITEGVTPSQFKALLEKHPMAKAVLFVYPNYYGVGIHLKELIALAHERGLIVLIDEAHGPHFPFSDDLPEEALKLGADMVAQSTHKLLGSLTQTSMLHVQGRRVDIQRVKQVYQMLQSTSPNYILLASLDMARQQMAIEGKGLMDKVIDLAKQLRQMLSRLPGIAVLEEADIPVIEGKALPFDPTKILVDVSGLGITGLEAEEQLRRNKIEVELVHGNHVLLLLTIGDTEDSIHAVLSAIQHISDTFAETASGEQNKNSLLALPNPDVVLSPREAFRRRKIRIPLAEAKGAVSGESISYYPPGIPCLVMGERITEEVIAYLKHRKELGYMPNGASDMQLDTILVIVE